MKFAPGADLSSDDSIQVAVREKCAASVVLRAVNRYAFSDLSHLAWSWQLVSNRSAEPVHCGHFELHTRNGVQDVVLILDSAVSSVRQLEQSGPTKYFLNISGFLVSDSPWAEAGHIVVREQFKVNFLFEESLTLLEPLRSFGCASETCGRLEVLSNLDEIRVFFSDNHFSSPLVALQKTTGNLVVYSPKGRNLLADSARSNFTRAATDNDKGGIETSLNHMFSKAMHPLSGLLHPIYGLLFGKEEFSHYLHWKRHGFDESTPPRAVCSGLNATEKNQGAKVEVSAVCSIVSCLDKELFKISLLYEVFSDSRVCISHHIVPHPSIRRIASIPRVGMKLHLDPSLYHIQYFGRGPEENYPDRQAGSFMGVYRTTPSKMAYTKYVVPSENGSRSDCEWISFVNRSGAGVLIVSENESNETKFSCSAQLHSSTELDSATHTCDLEKRKDGSAPIHVNIDSSLMGLGGDNR